MTSEGPLWSQPEAAWLLALVTAFGLTWAGSAAGFPLVGPLAAGGAGASLSLLLMRRGRLGAAGLAALASGCGAALASLGWVLERGWEAARAGFPPAETLVGRGLERFDALAFGLRLVLVVGALAAARPTRGYAPIVVAVPAFAALGALGGWFATRVSPSAEVVDGLLGISPWVLFQLAGLALAGTGLAAPGAPGPWADLDPTRRRLLGWGLGLLAAGVALEPVLGGPWARWRLGMAADFDPGC